MSIVRFYCVVVILTGGSLFAQTQYTTAESGIGKQLYVANCMVCHGPEGDAINGVDLGHGQFRVASSDTDLMRVMKNGIPGTGMPANNLTDEQARQIVAYLRSMAASAASNAVPPGDAGRGKSIFEGKGECLSCHRVGANGSRVGPDLSDVGSLRRAVELQRSIAEPAAEVLPNHRFVRLVMRTGATLNGRLLNQDSFTIQILDSKEQLVSLSRTDVREFTFLNSSPMPSYATKLTSQELTDLVSYLASLKGR